MIECSGRVRVDFINKKCRRKRSFPDHPEENLESFYSCTFQGSWRNWERRSFDKNAKKSTFNILHKNTFLKTVWLPLPEMNESWLFNQQRGYCSPWYYIHSNCNNAWNKKAHSSLAKTSFALIALMQLIYLIMSETLNFSTVTTDKNRSFFITDSNRKMSWQLANGLCLAR